MSNIFEHKKIQSSNEFQPKSSLRQNDINIPSANPEKCFKISSHFHILFNFFWLHFPKRSAIGENRRISSLSHHTFSTIEFFSNFSFVSSQITVIVCSDTIFHVIEKYFYVMCIFSPRVSDNIQNIQKKNLFLIPPHSSLKCDVLVT